MLACPNCDRRIVRKNTPHGPMHVCLRCGGRMVSTAALRKEHASRGFLSRAWRLAREASASFGRPCPVCAGQMRRVDVPVDVPQDVPQDSPEEATEEAPDNAPARGLELDVCLPCASIWFDSGEYGDVPRAAAAGVLEPHGIGGAGAPSRSVEVEPAREGPAPQAPSPEWRAEITEAVREQDRIRARLAEQRVEAARGEPLKPVGRPLDKVPIERWKYLPAILGFPVECSMKAPSRGPWVTWGAVALCAALFGLSIAMGPEFFGRLGEEWGFKPAEWYRLGGATLLAGFFIHGGLWHLLGNMYFLMIFGDNVEDNLGRGRYVWLLVVAHLAGAAVHGLLDARPELPLVGASAGISGVIAYYAVAFPRARLGFLFLFVKWFRVPAWGAFILWIAVQVFTAKAQAEGRTNVSGLAHLGGAAVGLVAGLALRKRRKVGRKAQKAGERFGVGVAQPEVVRAEAGSGREVAAGSVEEGGHSPPSERGSRGET